METLQQYIHWRDGLLHKIADTICLPCADPRKRIARLDYANPLNCGCRCERVEELIKSAASIDADIQATQRRR